MKILVVDDELLVRRSLSRVCAGRGHDVREAADGQEGIEIWREWKPDLVLLDVLMPKLTGPELLKRLTKNEGAKVILMSAYTGSTDMEQARLAGADLFLPKPFHDIFAVIDQAEELCRVGSSC